MKVKSYSKFLESNSDEYSIYDWYYDLRHDSLSYQENKKCSEQFIGPGIFSIIERKIDEIFSMFEKINLDMISDMLVDLYDYVPQNKLKIVYYCVLNGEPEKINDTNTQSKFNGAQCFSNQNLNSENKWSVIRDILIDIIRPTLYVNLEGEYIELRMDSAKYGSKYDSKYSCVNFNWQDYSVNWGGNIVSPENLPNYKTKEIRTYNLKDIINMRQPGIYIDIDNDNSDYKYFNLMRTEEILDEIVPMIKDYIEDNGVQVEEFMFDNTRGQRQYDSNTDIMDYTLKILLKQGKV